MNIIERAGVIEASVPLTVRNRLRWTMSPDIADRLGKELFTTLPQRGWLLGYPYTVDDTQPVGTLRYEFWGRVDPPNPASVQGQLVIALPANFTSGETIEVLLAVMREQERIRRDRKPRMIVQDHTDPRKTGY